MKHVVLPHAAGTASVVSLRHRYALVVNSKTAGSTLKAIAAVLEAEPLASRGVGIGRDERAQRVENWIRTPTLADLSPNQIRRLYFSDDFFRFTTVRHPIVRCWSAYIDKILGGHPEYADYAAYGWRNVPSDGEALVRGFEKFATALRDRPGLLGADRHWAPQVAVLAIGAFPYDFVGRTEEFDDVCMEWGRATGLDVRQVARSVGRRNARSLAFPWGAVGPASLEALAAVYAADLDAFGYSLEAARPEAQPDDWFGVASDWLAMLGADRDGLSRTRRRGHAWEWMRKESAQASRRVAARRHG